MGSTGAPGRFLQLFGGAGQLPAARRRYPSTGSPTPAFARIMTLVRCRQGSDPTPPRRRSRTWMNMQWKLS